MSEGDWPHLPWWTLYRTVQSLFCTPETNIIQDVNYAEMYNNNNKVVR